mmetsp:Transcript_7612/g.23020  ORF Transcript_7612/g.23020 Transcript_7612/m.23020 type:complete len:252 (-) Transcript_7612:209-964(-)|eukprot:CAMPEP_0113687178 /NCGR_PEP_ID=MMETSP0038_2-20120614/15770_1 /TAXON_ID=2898 /ORGANISM="Cryptomonas paramecium" /LENGTH=251 /DNA_ID=CAMNT_0000607721 /DNA_START=146 /DNA_END=901 /DNA_ORIENTATION=- /assembly_acc=CAM_ASM_000170
MEDFAHLVSELTEPAKKGDFAHVREVLRDAKRTHFLWQANSLQQEGIDRCVDHTLSAAGGETTEQLLKGWVVTSVNEWGGDQERILILTDKQLHRVHYDFSYKTVSSVKSIPLSEIIRVEYGSFRAAAASLTTWVFKKEIEQMQGIRVYTHDLDGNRSINALAREQLAPVLGPPPPAAQEHYREYRAFGAEDEPWREEVFAQELAAAFMAASILSGASFDVRPAEMSKEVPGGIFSMFYNSLNLGKYSKGA